MGPSALGVDDAITALQESIDWMRLRNYSLPGALLTHHASDRTSSSCLCPCRAACAVGCVRLKCGTAQSARQMYASTALSHLASMGHMHLESWSRGSQISVPYSSELPAAVKPARAARAQWHAAVQGPAQEQHRQHLLRGRRGEPIHSQGWPDVRHVQVPGIGNEVLLCGPLASQELVGLPSQSQKAVSSTLWGCAPRTPAQGAAHPWGWRRIK